MKLISRTVSENIYEVMVINVKTKEVRNTYVNVGSVTFKDDNKALDYIRSTKDNDTVKSVMIVSKQSRDKLYVMPETLFMQYAVPCDDMKAARAYFKKTQGLEDVEEEQSAEG